MLERFRPMRCSTSRIRSTTFWGNDGRLCGACDGLSGAGVADGAGRRSWMVARIRSVENGVNILVEPTREFGADGEALAPSLGGGTDGAIEGARSCSAAACCSKR